MTPTKALYTDGDHLCSIYHPFLVGPIALAQGPDTRIFSVTSLGSAAIAGGQVNPSYRMLGMIKAPLGWQYFFLFFALCTTSKLSAIADWHDQQGFVRQGYCHDLD